MSPAVSIATVVLALTLYATPRVPAQLAPDGVPQPAIDAVIAAFSSHDIVALDEGAHGNVAGLSTNGNPLLDAFKRFCGIASKN